VCNGYVSRAETYAEEAVALSTGYRSRAVSHGGGSVAIAAGMEGKAAGEIGDLLIWIIRDEGLPPRILSAEVDGTDILPGVPYQVIDGVITKVPDKPKTYFHAGS
jgi:hypothetical protein